MKYPTLTVVEDALGEPASVWGGRCYEIACAIIEHWPKLGVAVYGHWTGPISPTSFFAHKSGIGFCQHGWIALADGHVLDPTRWVFEGVSPYLYTGPSDYYDEGGNTVREALSPAAMPAFNPSIKSHELSKRTLPDQKALDYVRQLSGSRGRIDVQQLCWLANRNPRSLNGHARAIFAMIICLGREAFIPIDNRRMVDEGRL